MDCRNERIYISVNAGEAEYNSLYHNFGPFLSQEEVQELAYKLIQISPIITPYTATEAVRFYGIYGTNENAISGKFKNILKLVEKGEDYITLDKNSERYQEFLRKDWGDLALEDRRRMFE